MLLVVTVKSTMTIESLFVILQFKHNQTNYFKNETTQNVKREVRTGYNSAVLHYNYRCVK